jgi:hypothetical protein
MAGKAYKCTTSSSYLNGDLAAFEVSMTIFGDDQRRIYSKDLFSIQDLR